VVVTNSFSLVINHTPWVPARVEAIADMALALFDSDRPEIPLFVNDIDYRGTDWQVSKVKWALDQWRWSASQPAKWHVFMTDDLHIMPGFWGALDAMTRAIARPVPIGLLSNHPHAYELFRKGAHWYRTNSWLVGPAYVLPHQFLLDFLAYFEALPDGGQPGQKGYANDDSSINEFVTRSGLYSLHPLPTIIEHRGDIGSTVGHGDQHSRERVSWREWRGIIRREGGWEWVSGALENAPTPATLASPEYWAGAEMSQMVSVGE
jgi:hypothetical protein